MVCSRCNQKTLNNFTCLPNPPTLGVYPQLLISDGNEGTQWSNSLLGEEAAVLSAYVAEAYSVPVGGWTVPAATPAIRLLSGALDSGDVVLGLDFSATTARAFSIFDATGANLTTQRILVSVNYSVNFSGANNGECGVWVQIIGTDLIPKEARYGSTNQTNIAEADGGNLMTGSTVIGLAPGESAAFYVKNTSNQTQTMIGDNDINDNPMTTKFQSALIN